METRYLMEMLMMSALVLYLGSYFEMKRSWAGHVALATLGFGADTYATYLMVQMDFGFILGDVAFHISFTLSAALAFVFHAYLGYKAKWSKGYQKVALRQMHMEFVKCALLPIWCLAYFSGFLLFL